MLPSVRVPPPPSTNTGPIKVFEPFKTRFHEPCLVIWPVPVILLAKVTCPRPGPKNVTFVASVTALLMMNMPEFRCSTTAVSPANVSAVPVR